MRRILLIAGLLLISSVGAMAQEPPHAEAFVGYSYQRTQVVGSTAFNLNGWNGSLQGNLNEWLGFIADFSGHYGRPSGVSVNLHSFLFGPQLTYRKAERLNPFVRGLAGVTRASAGFGGLSASDTSVAWAVGAGVNVKLNDRVAVRVIQADYVQTRFFDNKQNHARLSFGVVVRIGKR